VAAALAAVLAPGAVAGAAPAAQSPPLAARLSACTADAGAGRSATFTGSMPRGPRGGRLAMRFVLLERTPLAAAERPVPTPPFETWVSSAAGAGGLVHDRTVRALHEPSDYRVEVRFRWYDARGQVARTAIRHSPACRPA
jgi:hypothetical protein